MTVRTSADFAREYRHALSSDFASDGVPATFAPTHPRRWSSAPVTLVIGGTSPADITTFAINCTGTLLALAVLSTVRVYSLGTLQLVYALKGHVGRVTRISWHPTNENVLATGSQPYANMNESLVRVWDLAGIEAGAELPVDRVAKRAAGLALELLPDMDGSTGAAAPPSNGEALRLAGDFSHALLTMVIERDVQRGEALRGELSAFGGYAFDGAGAHLLYVEGRKTAVVYDLARRAARLRLAGHTDSIMWVGASADGATLASSAWDRTVRLWDAHTGQPLHVLTGATGQSWGGAFSADGRLVAAGCGDTHVRVWRVDTGELVHTLDGFTGWVRRLAFSCAPPPPVGRGPMLAAAGAGKKGGTVRVFDLSSGATEMHWQVDVDARLAGFAEIGEVGYSGDGSKLAFKGPDGRLVVYDAKRNVKWEFVRDDDDKAKDTMCGGSFAFAPNGKMVWSLDVDGVLRGWDMA